MSELVGQAEVSPPAAYSCQEAGLVLAGPVSERGRRANLILKTVAADGRAPVGELLDRSVAQIRAAGGDKLSDVVVEPFTFADEVEGRLVAGCFSMRGVSLQQWHAIRVDGARVTTLSVTAEVDAGDAAAPAVYLAALRSARARGG